MPTSATAGFVAKLDISTDGGSVYNDIAEQAEISLTVNGEAIDVTNTDSGVNKEFIPGQIDWTISASGNLVDGDTGQDAAFTNIAASTEIDLRIRTLGDGAGLPEWTGAAVLTSWETSGGTGGSATSFSLEAQGNGALTKATQV